MHRWSSCAIPKGFRSFPLQVRPVLIPTTDHSLLIPKPARKPPPRAARVIVSSTRELTMITFNCSACGASFTVPDSRTGQRTTCPVCRAKLVVPGITEGRERESPPDELEKAAPVAVSSTSRKRPPVKVVIALIAAAVTLLVAVGLILSWLAPPPTKQAVERALKLKLPPGHEDFLLLEYEPKAGRVKFQVRYREYGDPIGVLYEVARFDDDEGMFGPPGWRVQIIGRRFQWNQLSEKWLMVDTLFDGRAKLLSKRLSAADAREGPVFEERARQLAQAVNATF